MRSLKRVSLYALILAAALSVSYRSAAAQNNQGFDRITKHLKTRYQAKKRSIPFFGLAKFAVRLIKPAGVKSISLSLFEDLKNTNELPDAELSDMMRNALSAEWQPLVCMRSRSGDQVYVYVAESGKDLKLAVLVINQSEAALARVKINPEALRKFIDDPKIFGISLGGENRQQQALQSKPDEK